MNENSQDAIVRINEITISGDKADQSVLFQVTLHNGLIAGGKWTPADTRKFAAQLDRAADDAEKGNVLEFRQDETRIRKESVAYISRMISQPTYPLTHVMELRGRVEARAEGV